MCKDLQDPLLTNRQRCPSNKEQGGKQQYTCLLSEKGCVCVCIYILTCSCICVKHFRRICRKPKSGFTLEKMWELGSRGKGWVGAGFFIVYL